METNMTTLVTAITPTEDPEKLYKDLISVVLQCFLIILIGYLTGKVGFLSENETKGLSKFVSCFSLPALIFSSLATSDLHNVKWNFVATILLSKTTIFVIVALVTLILTKPANVGLAGLYAIFSTQSNDFALGYPLLKSLYKNSHSDYAQYIYFLAPIQLVVLNPIGLLLMEVHRQRQQSSMEGQSLLKVVIRVAKGILSNPIIIMTCLGIIWNVVFSHQLPSALAGLLEVFGSAFSATALFLLGLNMVNKVTLLQGPPLLVPGILIALKNLIMPLVIRQTVYMLYRGGSSEEMTDFGNLGFLYGTFPAAPTVFIFALQFELSVEVISVGMVASTILAAPFMFLSANMIQMTATTAAENFQKELSRAMTYVSVVSSVCCIWVFIMFVVGKRWKRVTHGVTTVLVIFQLMVALGGIIWSFIDLNNHTLVYLQFILALTGTLASRLWTALLALILALLQWRSLCFVLRVRHVMMILSLFITLGLVIFLTVGMGDRVLSRNETDPSFQFGSTQAAVAMSVIILSLIMTTICLIFQQRHQSTYVSYQSINGGDSDDNEEEAAHSADNAQPTSHHPRPVCRHLITNRTVFPDLEDLTTQTPSEVSLITPSTSAFPDTCGDCFSCSLEQQKQCNEHVRQYYCSSPEPEHADVQDIPQEENHQITRHILLVLLLSLSMIFGLAACIWKLINTNVTGIFLELEFVDIFLNYGQGIFTFLIFGLDAKLVIQPIVYLWNRLRSGWSHTPSTTCDMRGLPEDKNLICNQFLMFHKRKCQEDIAFEHQIGSILHFNVFYGKDFVDWLVGTGLVFNRQDATRYANCLLESEIIEHVFKELPFQDGPQMYRFVTVPRR